MINPCLRLLYFSMSNSTEGPCAPVFTPVMRPTDVLPRAAVQAGWPASRSEYDATGMKMS